MKRFLKKHFNRFLPDALRDLIKQRLQSKLAKPVSASLIVEETYSSLRCTIDNSWSFLTPIACKAELENFVNTSRGRAEFNSIARAARSGGVLFDVGAHSGLISALFCAADSRNRVFSFEPSPVLTQRLSAIHELNQFGDRMSIEQVAIGESREVLEMAFDRASGYIQSQRFDHTMWAAPEALQVSIESIPDAASRLNVIPQFIKLDIESYEFEAIKGALAFLSRYRPTIFLELHLSYLDQRNLSPKLVIEMLRQCGYEFYASGGSRLKAAEVYDSPLSNIHVVAR